MRQSNTKTVSIIKRGLCLLLLTLLSVGYANAQNSGMLINLSMLDGIALSPENIFAYSVQSTASSSTEAMVKGTVRYRQSGLSFSYSFHTTLRPGINRFEASSVRPDWNFSTAALRELFMDYRVMPEGTYEYCVSVNPVGTNGEAVPGNEVSECIYNKAEDLFLINLVDPENNAKLYEHYPVFSWVVNYPFASQLTYRIRVAEIKEGQNTVNAITRNNPVYTESNLPQTTTTYPAYSTPLKTFQDYAWTVDAYYKGILLGGAEPWKFTIIEDSLLVGVPKETYYVDIRQEQQGVPLYVLGKLKIKYVVQDVPQEKLTVTVVNKDGKVVSKVAKEQLAKFGDNRLDFDLSDIGLKHGGKYQVELSSSTGKNYTMPIIYVNPDFIK
jgi:hypothetical protein